MSEGLTGARCLVAGGAGFVGSNLARALLAGGADVLIVDNLLSAERATVPQDDRVDFIEGSITDPAVLSRLGPVDVVFDLTTYHGNQSSIANPLDDLENNLHSTVALFDHVARAAQPPVVVYAGAGCTVADKTDSAAVATAETETISLHLDSPYQISKIVGEMYANFYWRHAGLPVVKARFQNVYGPGEVLGAGAWRGTPATVWRNVVPTFIYRAIKGDELVLENGGRATRDFIYVGDIVAGLILAATRGQPGETYNLATGVATTIRDLALLIVKLVGSESMVTDGPIRPWDRSILRFGSTEKSERELGFVAGTSLEEGLRQTVAWTLEQLPVIERAIAQHRHRLAD